MIIWWIIEYLFHYFIYQYYSDKETVFKKNYECPILISKCISKYIIKFFLKIIILIIYFSLHEKNKQSKVQLQSSISLLSIYVYHTQSSWSLRCSLISNFDSSSFCVQWIKEYDKVKNNKLHFNLP